MNEADQKLVEEFKVAGVSLEEAHWYLFIARPAKFRGKEIQDKTVKLLSRVHRYSKPKPSRRAEAAVAA